MNSDLRVTRGYASVKIWAQAVGAAGTTDGIAVAQALRSGTFRVFGIEARFDEEGNVQGPLGEPALWLWQDRKPVPLQSDLTPSERRALVPELLRHPSESAEESRLLVTCCLTGHLAAESAAEGEAAEIAGKQT